MALKALTASCPVLSARQPRVARSVRAVRVQAVLAGPTSNGTAQVMSQPQQTLAQLPQDTVYVDTRGWHPINLAKATLMELQGIPLQKSVPEAGYQLTISFDAAADELMVIDYSKGLRFPAVFGPDNKVRVDLESAVPTPVVGLSFEALGQVLRADSAGAELINGRAAMLGIFIGLAGEVMQDDIVIRQLFSSQGAYNAMLVGALVLAASIAPAVLGRVPVQNVFPDEENPAPLSGDVPNIWNYNAERLNGRVAMIGECFRLGNDSIWVWVAYGTVHCSGSMGQAGLCEAQALVADCRADAVPSAAMELPTLD